MWFMDIDSVATIEIIQIFYNCKYDCQDKCMYIMGYLLLSSLDLLLVFLISCWSRLYYLCNSYLINFHNILYIYICAYYLIVMLRMFYYNLNIIISKYQSMLFIFIYSLSLLIFLDHHYSLCLAAIGNVTYFW